MTAGTPARRYSWPPFAEGNTANLRHGARSPKTYGPIARELLDGVLADRPDLAAWPEVLSAWCDAEARCVLLRRWLEEQGMFDEDGEPRNGALRWLSSFDKRASELRNRLGLDPRSEAELLRDRADATRSAFDLDAIRARGRDARLAAEATQLPAVPSDPVRLMPAALEAPGAAESVEVVVGS